MRSAAIRAAFEFAEAGTVEAMVDADEKPTKPDELKV